MDLERAQQALINADKAGDTKAATALAAHIRSLSAPPEQEARREGGAMSDFVSFQKGAADTISFGFGDEIKAGLQAGVRGGIDPNVTVKDAYSHFLDKARAEQAASQELNPNFYTGGQVAGAFVPAIGVGSKALKGVQSLAGTGKIGRTAAAFGTGATQGQIYGMGSGEGGVGERAEQGLGMGLAGGLGGVAGLGVASTLGKAARPLTERVKKIFRRPSAETAAVSRTASGLPDKPAKGDVFSMTEGQATQNPQAQRLEADALAGLYGDDAERLARMAQVSQSRERGAFISQLGEVDAPGDSGDAIIGAIEVLGKQAKKLKGQVNNAYDLAREGGGVKINANDVKDGFFARIGQVKKDAGFDLEMMPFAKKRVSDAVRLVRKSSGGKFETSTLDDLEKWRRRTTTAANSTTDKSEKLFLNKLVGEYDNFMYKTANEAVDKSDEAAIMAFRDAVSKRREYGRLYESDKFVKAVVNGEKTVDDAVKDLLGTGSLVGKKRLESTYDAVIAAAGNEADLVRSDLQAGFAKKLLEQSTSGLEAGGERAMLSAAKTKKALEGLFVNNRAFAKKLFGEDNYEAALLAIGDLDKIASTQSATQNPSGSGQLVLRALNRLPLVNIASQSVEVAGKAAKTGAVQKSLGETIKDIKIKPQSNLFKAATAGGLSAAAIAEGEDK